MKKSLILTYGLLILLTLTTALIASFIEFSKIAVVFIIGLSAVKFLLVTFQFMELKKANLFWKVSLCFVLGLICLLIIIL